MPIPLLFIAIGGGTAALGLGKSIKAGVDQKQANEINGYANDIVEEAKEKIDRCRKECGEAVASLGKRKINVLDNSVRPFITEFEKLSHVEFDDKTILDEHRKMILDRKEFAELKQLQSMASSMVGGVASGAVAGAITALGAYGAAGALATASTGTAIATLSGAAATNATLAFFGGGSLAVGGLGIAGGTAVLGGLVAGPALAVIGFVAGAKASGNKDKAYTNFAKAKEFKEEMDVASEMCIGIKKRAAMFEQFLIKLNLVFDPLVYKMKQIIDTKGTDYRKFSTNEKAVVAEAMTLAGTIKSVLDTPILDKEGRLTEESEEMEKFIHDWK